MEKDNRGHPGSRHQWEVLNHPLIPLFISSLSFIAAAASAVYTHESNRTSLLAYRPSILLNSSWPGFYAKNYNTIYSVISGSSNYPSVSYMESASIDLPKTIQIRINFIEGHGEIRDFECLTVVRVRVKNRTLYKSTSSWLANRYTETRFPIRGVCGELGFTGKTTGLIAYWNTEPYPVLPILDSILKDQSGEASGYRSHKTASSSSATEFGVNVSDFKESLILPHASFTQYIHIKTRGLKDVEFDDYFKAEFDAEAQSSVSFKRTRLREFNLAASLYVAYESRKMLSNVEDVFKISSPGDVVKFMENFVNLPSE